MRSSRTKHTNASTTTGGVGSAAASSTRPTTSSAPSSHRPSTRAPVQNSFDQYEQLVEDEDEEEDEAECEEEDGEEEAVADQQHDGVMRMIDQHAAAAAAAMLQAGGDPSLEPLDPSVYFSLPQLDMMNLADEDDFRFPVRHADADDAADEDQVLVAESGANTPVRGARRRIQLGGYTPSPRDSPAANFPVQHAYPQYQLQQYSQQQQHPQHPSSPRSFNRRYSHVPSPSPPTNTMHAASTSLSQSLSRPFSADLERRGASGRASPAATGVLDIPQQQQVNHVPITGPSPPSRRHLPFHTFGNGPVSVVRPPLLPPVVPPVQQQQQSVARSGVKNQQQVQLPFSSPIRSASPMLNGFAQSKNSFHAPSMTSQQQQQSHSSFATPPRHPLPPSSVHASHSPPAASPSTHHHTEFPDFPSSSPPSSDRFSSPLPSTFSAAPSQPVAVLAIENEQGRTTFELPHGYEIVRKMPERMMNAFSNNGSDDQAQQQQQQQPNSFLNRAIADMLHRVAEMYNVQSITSASAAPTAASSSSARPKTASSSPSTSSLIDVADADEEDDADGNSSSINFSDVDATSRPTSAVRMKKGKMAAAAQIANATFLTATPTIDTSSPLIASATTGTNTTFAAKVRGLSSFIQDAFDEIEDEGGTPREARTPALSQSIRRGGGGGGEKVGVKQENSSKNENKEEIKEKDKEKRFGGEDTMIPATPIELVSFSESMILSPILSPDVAIEPAVSLPAMSEQSTVSVPSTTREPTTKQKAWKSKSVVLPDDTPVVTTGRNNNNKKDSEESKSSTVSISKKMNKKSSISTITAAPVSVVAGPPATAGPERKNSLRESVTFAPTPATGRTKKPSGGGSSSAVANITESKELPSASTPSTSVKDSIVSFKENMKDPSSSVVLSSVVSSGNNTINSSGSFTKSGGIGGGGGKKKSAGGKKKSSSSRKSLSRAKQSTREISLSHIIPSAPIRSLVNVHEEVWTAEKDGTIVIRDSRSGDFVPDDGVVISGRLYEPRNVMSLCYAGGLVWAGTSNGMLVRINPDTRQVDLGGGESVGGNGASSAGSTSIVPSTSSTTTSSKPSHRSFTSGITQLVFNGKDRIFSSSSDHMIRSWSVPGGAYMRTYTGHTLDVRAMLCLGFTQLWSASSDSTIRIFNVSTGECLQVLTGHTDAVTSLVAVGMRVVSGSADGTIRVWNQVSTGSGKAMNGGLAGEQTQMNALTGSPLPPPSTDTSSAANQHGNSSSTSSNAGLHWTCLQSLSCGLGRISSILRVHTNQLWTVGQSDRIAVWSIASDTGEIARVKKNVPKGGHSSFISGVSMVRRTEVKYIWTHSTSTGSGNNSTSNTASDGSSDSLCIWEHVVHNGKDVSEQLQQSRNQTLALRSYQQYLYRMYKQLQVYCIRERKTFQQETQRLLLILAETHSQTLQEQSLVTELRKELEQREKMITELHSITDTLRSDITTHTSRISQLETQKIEQLELHEEYANNLKKVISENVKRREQLETIVETMQRDQEVLEERCEQQNKRAEAAELCAKETEEHLTSLEVLVTQLREDATKKDHSIEEKEAKNQAEITSLYERLAKCEEENARLRVMAVEKDAVAASAAASAAASDSSSSASSDQLARDLSLLHTTVDRLRKNLLDNVCRPLKTLTVSSLHKVQSEVNTAASSLQSDAGEASKMIRSIMHSHLTDVQKLHIGMSSSSGSGASISDGSSSSRDHLSPSERDHRQMQLAVELSLRDQ